MPALLELIAALHPNRRTRIVAIDGLGASGKTTLAKILASRAASVTIVPTDDFSRPEVPGWEWQRMKSQVLDPLSQDQPGRYQRHDWPSDRLAEWHDVPVAGTVIVEGVSALRHELGRYWDLAIWVTCSHAVRLKRGIARDGEASRRQWEDVWIPEEDAYLASQKPQERADVVVSGEEPYV
jgi:uridine kinase